MNNAGYGLLDLEIYQVIDEVISFNHVFTLKLNKIIEPSF